MRKLYKSNTSGHPGVTWDSARKKWRGSLYYKGKQYHLGYFAQVSDAADKVSAYRAALKDRSAQV